MKNYTPEDLTELECALEAYCNDAKDLGYKIAPVIFVGELSKQCCVLGAVCVVARIWDPDKYTHYITDTYEYLGLSYSAAHAIELGFDGSGKLADKELNKFYDIGQRLGAQFIINET